MSALLTVEMLHGGYARQSVVEMEDRLQRTHVLANVATSSRHSVHAC
jgi:hypothetical protein